MLKHLQARAAKNIVEQVVRPVKTSLYPETSTLESPLSHVHHQLWNQKPLLEAMADLPTTPQTKARAPVLKLSTNSSLIARQDFVSIYPPPTLRKYSLEDNTLGFRVVKARNPVDLTFENAYYLIFDNYNQACAYWLETSDKTINGTPLSLEFVNVDEDLVRDLFSPLLERGNRQHLAELRKLSPTAAFSEVMKCSDSTKHVEKVLERFSSNDLAAHAEWDVDPGSKSLVWLANPTCRKRSVLVKNLPFNLSKYSLPNLLWNYNLYAVSKDQQDSFTHINVDSNLQLHRTLVRFGDSHNAYRFVRNFHGKEWTQIQRSANREKKLYDPILCEILDY